MGWSGFRFQDSVSGSSVPRFRVQGSGLRVQDSGFRIQDSEFRVNGFEPALGVQSSGFRDRGSGFENRGSGFRVQGSGFRVQGSGFRVWGLETSLGVHWRMLANAAVRSAVAAIPESREKNKLVSFGEC